MADVTSRSQFRGTADDSKAMASTAHVPDATGPGSADESASWLAALVASTAEVIIGADTDGKIIVWNQGAASLYGYSETEAVGQSITILCMPGDERIDEVLRRVRVGDPIPTFESYHVTKDGRIVDVSLTVSAVRGPDGEVIGSSAFVRDISATKRAQEALEQAVVSERVMVEKLTDLDRVRTSFVSSVSHELRTPLTSILGYLELLSENHSGMNEHQLEMLDIGSRNSRRLLALIEDLLVLSRIESGAFKVLKEPVDVRALVNAVAHEAKPMADVHSHRLVVSVEDSVGSVLGDATELERLLMSLLSNAIKFTPARGEIVVRAERVEGGTKISVSDTGLGIPERELADVFNSFFRSAVADRRAIPGTGLGLPIAKTIVEQHGGTIGCESEPGKGTRVTVILPFAIQERRAS